MIPAADGSAAKGRIWPKPAPDLVERFTATLEGFPEAERRKMFGHPCAFLYGHMFTGLVGDDWFVRLGLEDRATLLDLPGATPFEPMPGRPMSGYAVLPRDLTGDPEAARPWVERAATFAASLPPKAAKKSAKAPGARKTHSGR